MALNKTRADAERRGYTKEVFGSGGAYDLELLIIPGTDLDEAFPAYDLGEEEFITVNGWLFDWEDC